MKTQKRSRQTLAALVTLTVLLSVFSPVGIVAAAPDVTTTHSTNSTTVAPGDTVTITATFVQTDANSPAMVPSVPDGWTITDTTAASDWSYFAGQGTFLGGLALSDGDGVSGTYTHAYTVQVPADAQPGDYTITSEGSVIEPASGDRLVDTASTTVTVEADNAAPSIDAIADQTVDEGDSTTVPVTASDADGDAVSLSVSGPEFVSLASGDLTIAPQTGDAGTYTVDVTADDGTDQTTESFQVTVEESDAGGSGDVVFAVNAGGGTYTATDGTVYAADTNFDGGDTFTSGSSGTPSEPAIANTDDDTLYWSERYGDFSYGIPVAESGQYEVTLHFAEIYQGVANNGGEGDRVFNASVEGQQVLTNYDIIVESGAPHTAVSESYTVEVTDGTLNVDFTTVEDNAKVSAITVEKVGDVSPGETSADVAITSGSGVDASTYGGGSYQVTNTGDTEITTVTVDLSETVLPDMVFDPFATAGDNVGKEFSLDGGDVTVQNVEYTNFHNGQDNSAGYDTLVVTLSGFGPGETMAFSLDNDPTSITSTPLGSQAAGPVSGLELAGGTVSIDDGSGPVEATIVGDGSAGGATATVMADESESPPTIGVEGVSLSGTTLSDRHSAATVASADQTITVAGAPANADVTLMRVEGELNLNNVPSPYEVEEYESNKAVAVEYYSTTTDANGEATVDVTLTDAAAVEESGLNSFVAWVEEPDGDTGPTSDYVVLELDPDAANTAPMIDAISDQTVTEGDSTTVPVTVSDDEGDDVSLSVSGPDFVSLADGNVTIAPQTGDAGTYTVTVTADDGTDQSTAMFAVTVAEPETNAAPTIDAISDQTVTEGDSIVVPVTASDSDDGDIVTLSVSGADFVSLSDDNVTIAPQSGDAGTYTVDVTADDGTDQTTESFQVTVEAADTGPGPVGDFENAPTDPDGDGLFEDVNGDEGVNFGDVQALFANIDDSTVQSNVDAFDFNDDQNVNFGDVQALFAQISGV